MRKYLPFLIYIAVLLLLFGWISGAFGMGQNDLAYSQIVELFEQEQVKSFVVNGNDIQLDLHEPYNGKTRVVCALGDLGLFHQDLDEIIRKQSSDGVLESYTYLPVQPTKPLDYVLPC